ncbi:PAS domain S-box protein [Methylomonas sp. MgM2]
MHRLIDTLSFNMLIIRFDEPNDQTVSPHIVQANTAVANLLGYSKQELIGLTLETVLSTRASSFWEAVHSKQVNTETDSCFGVEIITKRHQSFQALVSISFLPQACDAYSEAILLIQAIKPGNDFLVMRRVIAQSASAMMITDASGRIQYVNPRFSEMSGYSADELLGQKPTMLQSGNMTEEFYQSMWDALVTTGAWHGEILNKHKKGHNYWVYESVSAIKNSAGEITHFLAVEEDVTHRKEVDMALAESEERFRQMADISGEWLWEQDPKGYYTYSSVAVNQILGFSQDEIIGKHYTELLTPQDKESQTNFSTSEQSFSALLNHYRHKDGHQVITESTGLPITDKKGNLLKWRGVDRDISARVRFQNALIDSEKRTRLIIESSLNAIVIMDSYGIITDWNRQAEVMFGWTAAEAVGRRLDELIIPERFHRKHREGLQTFLETGAGPILNRQIEHIAKRRDGREFPVELSVSPLKLGNAYIFSGFIHDISSRKAAEQKIRQAQVDLAVAQNEIKIAQQIQANLSPGSAIQTKDFEVTGFCLPADKVGGDYYDYFYRDDTLLDLVIADVSGHSIGPGLFMVETRSALRVQNNPAIKPAETLSILNNFLFKDLDQADYFISLFYMQMDLARQQITYSNAGHPPPLLFNRFTGKFMELDTDGLIVGVVPHVDFEQKNVRLTEGDIILLYTDGIIEAENPDREFFGIERVKAILREHASDSPQAIINALFTSLQQFCQAAVFNDDITLMVLKWR